MKRKSSKQKKNGTLWLFAILFILILLIIFSVGKRGFIRQIGLNQEINELHQELQAAKEEISRLEAEKEKLQTAEYKEKIAREEYGMAKENEKVYHVIPKDKIK